MLFQPPPRIARFADDELFDPSLIVVFLVLFGGEWI